VKKCSPTKIRHYDKSVFAGKVIAVGWAPESSDEKLNNRLICGDQGGHVMIMDAKKGCRMAGYNLSGPSKFVQAVSLHGKKNMALSGGMDNTISLFDLPDEATFFKCGKQWSNDGSSPDTGHDGMVSSLCFHPTKDEEFISTGGDGEVKLWNVKESKCLATYFMHGAECHSITFPKDVPSGQVFGTASNDGMVAIWDLRTDLKAANKCVMTLHSSEPTDKLSCADFFPNGNAIASGGQGQTTYMWDLRAVKQVAAFRRNNMKVTGCSFSKSGRALFVTHEDGHLICWDTFGPQDNQKYAFKFDAHKVPDPKGNPDPLSQITFCGLKPDGEFLATASFNSEVKVWGGLAPPA